MTTSKDSLTHHDLEIHLARIEGKVDTLFIQVAAIDKGLAVHKAKTGWMSLVMGGVASLLVALAAFILK